MTQKDNTFRNNVEAAVARLTQVTILADRQYDDAMVEKRSQPDYVEASGVVGYEPKGGDTYLRFFGRSREHYDRFLSEFGLLDPAASQNDKNVQRAKVTDALRERAKKNKSGTAFGIRYDETNQMYFVEPLKYTVQFQPLKRMKQVQGLATAHEREHVLAKTSGAVTEDNLLVSRIAAAFLKQTRENGASVARLINQARDPESLSSVAERVTTALDVTAKKAQAEVRAATLAMLNHNQPEKQAA